VLLVGALLVRVLLVGVLLAGFLFDGFFINCRRVGFGVGRRNEDEMVGSAVVGEYEVGDAVVALAVGALVDVTLCTGRRDEDLLTVLVCDVGEAVKELMTDDVGASDSASVAFGKTPAP